jgi:spore germination protein
MPTVSNTRAGAWDPGLVEAIINDPGLRARHVRAVVALIQKQGLAGVDIDIENLRATDRAGFTAFITQLATTPALTGGGRR